MAPICDRQEEEYYPDSDERGRKSDNNVSSVDESKALAAWSFVSRAHYNIASREPNS